MHRVASSFPWSRVPMGFAAPAAALAQTNGREKASSSLIPKGNVIAILICSGTNVLNRFCRITCPEKSLFNKRFWHATKPFAIHGTSQPMLVGRSQSRIHTTSSRGTPLTMTYGD